ncbi:glycoside hydrolase family 3 protein [Elizabethkingia sp. JS20170427COW]|uniref:glycoside hydrolase family 3 protein n=1 Tax=Elizabethkingia sp. JS20170427COW TaxID=2583851 RepID=UPI001110336B|nr:glycoside hydrolase family 3 protein [Elizabethkingia sp. JS20170427COW]QCX53599.1 glycoside hydrolase family 3 protein [Elizabethkingia sp. JS20170427COW]
MNKFLFYGTILCASIFYQNIFGQYLPKNTSPEDLKKAEQWVDQTYQSLNDEEKLGQLFIVALYSNKGNAHVQQVRDLVNQEKIGGIILMQDNAKKEIAWVNEFQKSSKIPLLVGMDAEWGLYQRISSAHKFPWAITLGAIQNNHLIYEMAAQIAEDAKKMGVNWNFAPVVDVNTNPNNPIIGNRSFGSDVNNVIQKGLAYTQGLQDHQVLAAIKHFPGHGDTDKDSHLDLPVVSHPLSRLNKIELAPFKALVDKGVGGIMVAHLYVPALESQKGIPASISHSIVTDLLKNQLGYKGLIITDALNMGAIAKTYQPGELDAKAFAAGEDIMLFSQGVKEGKRLILQQIQEGKIPKSRLEESVKKILLTKYLLGLTHFKELDASNIDNEINNHKHALLSEKLYANALTLLKNKEHNLPLKKEEKVYYLPLEEAPYDTFYQELSQKTQLEIIQAKDLSNITPDSKIIIGLHKDNSTAYKPYKISATSKNILKEASKNHRVILALFGSPYALKDIDLHTITSVVVAYENNTFSQKATAKALAGETKIHGRLPVLVNENLAAGDGKNLN